MFWVSHYGPYLTSGRERERHQKEISDREIRERESERDQRERSARELREILERENDQ